MPTNDLSNIHESIDAEDDNFFSSYYFTPKSRSANPENLHMMWTEVNWQFAHQIIVVL